MVQQAPATKKYMLGGRADWCLFTVMNSKASLRLSFQSTRPKTVSSGCRLARSPGWKEDELLKHPARCPKPEVSASTVWKRSHSAAMFEPRNTYWQVFSARTGTSGKHQEILRTKHAIDKAKFPIMPMLTSKIPKTQRRTFHFSHLYTE